MKLPLSLIVTWALASVVPSLLHAPAARASQDFPYSLSVDFTAPSYTGCGDPIFGDATVDCDEINPVAMDLGSAPNFMWVVVGDIPEYDGVSGGIGGVQFGIEYGDLVVMEADWALCTGGAQIPQDDHSGTWPESGTANAITWPGGCYEVTQNWDGVTRVGYFTIWPTDSWGTFCLGPDPRIGNARATDCLAQPYVIWESRIGYGDTHPGGSDGCSPCGGGYCGACDPLVGVAGSELAAKPPVAVLGRSPDPFSTHTTIEYRLAVTARVRLRIYDVSGRRVRHLDEGWHAPGTHALRWTGRDDTGRPVPQGIYFYRLEAAGLEIEGRLHHIR